MPCFSNDDKTNVNLRSIFQARTKMGLQTRLSRVGLLVLLTVLCATITFAQAPQEPHFKDGVHNENYVHDGTEQEQVVRSEVVRAVFQSCSG
eukprot:TRINITY_DN1140_c0_g1_i2.p1 TRINITY_DN1140_c0_g1~~TRINITY_DN1140_c0_g1_i2.p1  ORF type:complete len:104 (+),score=7.03 TRINITY_DN1140_c0_g1_i2:37-312(+)